MATPKYRWKKARMMTPLGLIRLAVRGDYFVWWWRRYCNNDLGSETLTVNKVGSSSYGTIQLRRSDTDGDTNGGYAFAQRDDASTSWVGLAGWDNGNRQNYLSRWRKLGR